jgi:hypothetical protein
MPAVAKLPVAWVTPKLPVFDALGGPAWSGEKSMAIALLRATFWPVASSPWYVAAIPSVPLVIGIASAVEAANMVVRTIAPPRDFESMTWPPQLGCRAV